MTRSQTLVRSLQPTPDAAPPRAGLKRKERPAEIPSAVPCGQNSAGPHPGDDIGGATEKITRGGRSVGGLAWATLISHRPQVRC